VPLAAPPCRPKAEWLAGLQGDPGSEDGADVGEAGQRWAAGRVPEPGRSHPGRGEPAPPRAGGYPPALGEPGAAPPAGDRPDPVWPDPQGGTEEVVRGGVHIAGSEEQAGNVAAGEPYLACVRPAGGGRRRPATCRGAGWSCRGMSVPGSVPVCCVQGHACSLPGPRSRRDAGLARSGLPVGRRSGRCWWCEGLVLRAGEPRYRGSEPATPAARPLAGSARETRRVLLDLPQSRSR